MSLSWIITQSATPQCDKSGLVISVRLTLTLTLTLASSEASFLFQFETKGTGSKISLSISLSSFHLHLQSFLTQTKPLCKFVALALKKWITFSHCIWLLQLLNYKVQRVSYTRKVSTNSGKGCQSHSQSISFFFSDVASAELPLASGECLVCFLI